MNIESSRFFGYLLEITRQFEGTLFNTINFEHDLFERFDKIIQEESDQIINVLITDDADVLLKNLEKVIDGGLCIVLSSCDNFFESLQLKVNFGYYRFYHEPEIQYYYLVGIKGYDITKYIPDYISDYKIGCRERRKTIVIYTFHEINDNVKFFVRHGIFKSPYIDFILVCNGCSDQLNIPDYVKYINRENIGHDFGGWSHAIYNEFLQDKYDYFVLINSSVRGPFIPPWFSDHSWVTIFTRLLDYQTKLVGTTLGIDEHLTHIQSTVLVLDQVGLDIGIQEGIFEQIPISRDKREIVIQKEIGLSQAIMRAGFKIRPIISAYYNTEITPKSVLRSRVHHMNNLYFETNLHPYEIIFIKDNHNINYNRDIDLLTTNHDSKFNRSINPTIPPNFNWISYINNQPEINDIFKNPEGAIKHWLNFGFYKQQKIEIPFDFNWQRYLALNPDVFQVYKDEVGAITHWLKYGFRENRKYS